MRIQFFAILLSCSLVSTGLSQSPEQDNDAWWNSTGDNGSLVDDAKDTVAEIDLGNDQQQSAVINNQDQMSTKTQLNIRELPPVRPSKNVSTNSVATGQAPHVDSMGGQPFAGLQGPSIAGSNLVRYIECGEDIGHAAWQGYSQERQAQLARQYAHINGTCGCFECRCGHHGKNCGGKICGSKRCSGLHDHVCVGKDCGHKCKHRDRVNRYRQHGHHGHGVSLHHGGHRLFKCKHGGCLHGSVCGHPACGQMIAVPAVVDGCSSCASQVDPSTPVIMSQRPAPVASGRVAQQTVVPQNAMTAQRTLIPIPAGGHVATGPIGQNIPR